MDNDGIIEEAVGSQAQVVADANARHGADDGFLAIIFKHKKMSRVHPRSNELYNG
jgi:hypothetical protein